MSDPDTLARLLSDKRLLIFDFDGTLVDSSPLHARAFSAAFAPFGVTVDYSIIAGLPTTEAVRKVADRAGVVLDDERERTIVRAKQERARDLIAIELEAMPGALDFVRRTEGRFAQALCTSASRATLDVALGKSGFDGRFDLIVTAEDVARGKPAPDIFEAALKHFSVHPDEALVFEDAPSGLAAAAAAGVTAIHVAGDGATTNWADLNAALDRLPT